MFERYECKREGVLCLRLAEGSLELFEVRGADEIFERPPGGVGRVSVFWL